MTEGNTINPESPAGECYRCGYDLRTIADDQPCPECGLLAGRSRRPTDELHNTRPRWLRSIAVGSNIILLTIAIGLFWTAVLAPILDSYSDTTFFLSDWSIRILIFSFVTLTVLMFCGVVLITRPEGYAPADASDRRRRIWLRIFAIVPILMQLPDAIGVWMMGAGFFDTRWQDFASWIEWTLGTIGLPPLVLLLFFHLHSLARRVRSAHLARHCAIVGIGGALTIIYNNLVRIFDIGEIWSTRPLFALILSRAAEIAVLVFSLWGLYVFIRFAIAFNRASRELRRKWTRDDHSRPIA